MGDLPLRTPTHRRLGGPLPRRLANAPHAHPPPDRSFPPGKMPSPGLRGISRDFSRLSPCGGQVAYVLLTRAPVAARSQQADSRAAPRLACVKPVASVHPEPGSNSSLLYLVFFFSCLLSRCALLLSLVKSARPQEIPPNTSALSVRSPSLIVLIFVLTCLVFHSSIDGNFT